MTEFMTSRTTRPWELNWTLFWCWFPMFLLFPGNWDVLILRLWELAVS